MKRRLAGLFLLLLMMVPAFGRAAGGKVYTSGKFVYALREDGTAEIVQYTGKKKKLEIPRKLKGKTVTGIGTGAFYWCGFLEEVIIPDTVTSIGDEAFYSCDSLPGITIPDSVSTIEGNPFRNCLQFTAVTVSPDHPWLTTVDGVLFSRADMRLICYPCAFTAESYTIPDGTAEIGKSAFICCRALKEIRIPDSVTRIGDSAFELCDCLTKLTLPESVTEIGKSAFSCCWNLTEIVIPAGVTGIGENAFYGCDKLTAIVQPGSFAERYCRENGVHWKTE